MCCRAFKIFLIGSFMHFKFNFVSTAKVDIILAYSFRLSLYLYLNDTLNVQARCSALLSFSGCNLEKFESSLVSSC